MFSVKSVESGLFIATVSKAQSQSFRGDLPMFPKIFFPLSLWLTLTSKGVWSKLIMLNNYSIITHSSLIMLITEESNTGTNWGYMPRFGAFYLCQFSRLRTTACICPSFPHADSSGHHRVSARANLPLKTLFSSSNCPLHLAWENRSSIKYG